MIRNIHIHGAHAAAFSAGDAFAFIALDPQQGKTAHGFQKHRDRAYIFAKRPVVLERKGHADSRGIVEQIAGNERPEHDPLHDFHPGTGR